MLTISALPLLLAIILTLIAYLIVSINGVFQDVEEVMIDAVLYEDRWLLREYGVIGFLVIRGIQGCWGVRWAVQKL